MIGIKFKLYLIWTKIESLNFIGSKEVLTLTNFILVCETENFF
jgi:hypothetical protein